MQASITYLPLLSIKPSNTLFPAKNQRIKTTPSTSSSIKAVAVAATATATATYEDLVFDYNSMDFSVFPVEACETSGGAACDAKMFPETKLEQEPKTSSNRTSQQALVDREYLQYDNPKTVFIAEACDHLGGEFCT